jgi:hypothetical protein
MDGLTSMVAPSALATPPPVAAPVETDGGWAWRGVGAGGATSSWIPRHKALLKLTVQDHFYSVPF